MRPTRRTIWCCKRCEVPGGPLAAGSRRYWRLFEFNSLVSSRNLRPGARSSNSADWSGLRQPWSGRWKGVGRREQGGLPAGRQGPHGERSVGVRLGKPARRVALTLRRTGPRPQTHRAMCVLKVLRVMTGLVRCPHRAAEWVKHEVANGRETKKSVSRCSLSGQRLHFSWRGNGQGWCAIVLRFVFRRPSSAPARQHKPGNVPRA
jgi:hypothetical protein